MTKREKRLRKIRNNPRNVQFRDLRTVLEDFGFVLVHTSGSHYIFEHKSGQKSIKLSIPIRNPVKPFYVREAIRFIDMILDEE